MSEWATSLIDELGYAAKLLGLTEGMAGNEFESALGRFIAFANALPVVEPLHEFGGKANVLADPANVQALLDSNAWLTNARRNVDAVRRVLQRNLFEQFNQARIDENSAFHSYSALHDQLRSAFDERPVFLAHVTTNFDHAIEAAIEKEGETSSEDRVVLDGFARSYGGKAETWAPNLLTFSRLHDGEIPVVHLHGAVGWYFSDDGNTIRRRPSNELIDDRLTPALLLPDDNKEIGKFPTPLRQVWDQFLGLLASSTHVLVLGHSLHDPHLVKELRSSQKPIAVVAYTEPDAKGRFDLNNSSQAQSLRELLPEAKLLAGKFGQRGPHSDIDPIELKIWMRDHAR
ncbi:SIR2 family protein [Leifsonia sp. EB41]|uniref:SIR2 family protein n=1 Tax=Leifsonia sp. EB41 TaxID=3156260 RepID=UPI0035186716